MFLKPLLDVFAIMNTKIIEDEKNLPVRIFDQSSHKPDQKLGIHGILVHHETHLAAVGDGRYHADMTLFGHHPDHRGLSFRGKTPNTVGSRLNPRPITPVNPGLRVAMSG